MPSLRTVTLGCKVNQYETEFLRQGLAKIGFDDALDGEPADLCLVNTCTVTAEGDAKSRQTVRQLAKKNPAARIVVMGCYATRAPEEVAALPNVAEVLVDKRELPDWLMRQGVREVPTGIETFRGRHRAFVKVQDGCMLDCSFCIIPHVRPGLASRPMSHILEECVRLAGNGFREIVLTGIHLGHYGVEWNRSLPKDRWQRLSHLVEQLAKLGELHDFRIRLSSIEATELTKELISALADNGERVCPHLHVSMQSGSDDVLRRMKRRWGRQRFLDRCQLANERLDLPALTTDVIVGFPGETESDFAATCSAVEQAGFSKLHVFSFSPRRGTPAATMSKQIPEHVKQARRRELLRIEAEQRARYYRSLLGRPLRVLVEGEFPDRPGTLLGTACRYAPVELSGTAAMTGGFVDVVATNLLGPRLSAVLAR